MFDYRMDEHAKMCTQYKPCDGQSHNILFTPFDTVSHTITCSTMHTAATGANKDWPGMHKTHGLKRADRGERVH